MARDLHRGDVVVAAAAGDYGKPRPALVVQSDLFNETHASVTVCPITSTLVDAPLFRVALKPARGNGLLRPSQVMVDKLQTLKRERISRQVGVLSGAQMHAVDVALRMWLRL
jgi:mRNA interferase MazF